MFLQSTACFSMCAQRTTLKIARMGLINALWTENPAAFLVSLKYSRAISNIAGATFSQQATSWFLDLPYSVASKWTITAVKWKSFSFFFLSFCKFPSLLCALNKLFLYNYADYYSSLIQFYFTTKRLRQQHFQSWTRTFSFHYND